MHSLARFYLERGKKEQGYEYFRRAAEVDPEVGESRWYAGISLFFDMGRREDGAREIVAAMKAKAPYSPKNVREAVIISTAYEIVRDADGYLQLLKTVPSLGGGDSASYVELARIAESLGLIPQRDLILNAVVKADPASAPRFVPLLVTHTATSINESLKQTPPPAVTPPTPAMSAAKPTLIVASSSPSGSGPRKR